MMTHDKTGGRTVELYIPFDYAGKKIERITFAPLRLGHVLRWNEGAWQSMIDMMVELSGVDVSVIRELRYPDADRVVEAFMALMTPEIRDDFANGRIPTRKELLDVPKPWPPAMPHATNGSGEPLQQGPGVPLPPPEDEAGFDLSEEP
jgi:hypothetical protein